MKLAVKFIIGFLLLFFAVYLLLPNPQFPSPPADSLQSTEPGDTETPLRRAYFTNYSRAQVLTHYQREFSLSFLGTALPSYRLNYPPEEANRWIKPITRSTFLEEIVHPFRESLFVNGFDPTNPSDEIYIKGIHFEQKIIVRYVPSSAAVRLALAGLSLALLFLIGRQWFHIYTTFRKQ